MTSLDALVEEISTLAAELIRVPSRAGRDEAAPVADVVAAWCARNRLEYRLLRADDGHPVGLCLSVTSGRPGPLLCLDACLDTAPFGDEGAWTHPPTAAVIRD